MNPVMILRYLKGYVSFCVKGGFTERFLNLCSKDEILLWDTFVTGTEVHSKCFRKDYKKLRSVSKKSGVTLSLTGQYGLLCDMKKKRNRVGLLIGFVFFLTFFAVMSRFIWTVDVSGNITLSKEDILIMAEQEGLSVGTYKPAFDEVNAALSLAKNSNGLLSWSAINIKGMRAVIEVREQKKSIKDTGESTPCNIVSDSDGVILSVEVFHGKSDILPGVAVKKGDLLISGITENEDFSSLFIEAKGKITAQTERSFSLFFPEGAKPDKICNAKKSHSVKLFTIKIPLTPIKSKSDKTLRHEKRLCWNGRDLPFSFVTEIYYHEEKVKRKTEELFLSALETFSYKAENMNQNALIVDENPEITKSETGFIIKNNWDLIAYIGEAAEISLKN